MAENGVADGFDTNFWLLRDYFVYKLKWNDIDDNRQNEEGRKTEWAMLWGSEV